MLVHDFVPGVCGKWRTLLPTERVSISGRVFGTCLNIRKGLRKRGGRAGLTGV
ncbi:hypothetical protein THTE_2809 [Thermogutta terrifontis]|uniref:Uncharacterized protein n=1 Tax=Thermogutta terrifontis TaxID=1331910 RepID=A0A286RHG6_9BACT|nr:hypothetical protein THTE_2809 [Thermogutta terrifontis]